VNEYTATNGVVVEDRGGSIILDGHCIVGAGSIYRRALREFFRAEEDERLGRWRWPVKPNYIVVPNDDEVCVFDDEALDEARIFSRDSVGFAGDFGAAAKAYFDAHPEPKPAWHDAKPGEVWALTTENVGDEIAARVADVNDELVFEYVASITTRIPVHDGRFTSGRRLWPEGDS
jgi:hypothetical protein